MKGIPFNITKAFIESRINDEKVIKTLYLIWIMKENFKRKLSMIDQRKQRDAKERTSQLRVY